MIENKADLCCDAKVGRCDEHYFLEHGVFSQFVSILELGVEFFRAHHIEVHHISNVKVEDPVLGVFNSNRVAHIKLEPLFLNHVKQLAFLLKGNLELFPLRFKVSAIFLKKVFVPLLSVKFTDLLKFFNFGAELIKNGVCFEDDLLEYFNRLANVNGFKPVCRWLGYAALLKKFCVFLGIQ